MKNEFRILLAIRKLKIKDVYKGTGISRTTLQGLYYETTPHPSATTILKICDFLEVTPNDFFGIKKRLKLTAMSNSQAL
ncbi:helix-turn-helix domain-containing protein [Staphylococcus haemolyticus]|uniref:helix-turn-helix domain-containing protein n=1 Tax=Staphylococcus haemolyticus TaxID=1283 RepID=UPI001141FA03|nr:helix-turn-helix transcriptional regulator [Staphylococcus haemolyticus]TPX84654.1 XRE family transcriptional regulator [Staphylococcus haemolyticus]